MVGKVGLKTGNKRAIYIIVSEGEEDSTVVREIRPDESWDDRYLPAICEYARVVRAHHDLTSQL